MNWSRVAITIIVVVSIYIVFIVFSDIGKIASIIEEIDKKYLLLSISIWLLVAVITATRWHIFLKQINEKIPFLQSLTYYLAGYVFVFSPAGAGEIIRSPFLKRDFGIPISKTASIVVIERFYDLLGITIVISIGLIYSNFEKSMIALPLGLTIFIFVMMKNRSIFLGTINKLSRFKFIAKMLPNGEESYNVISHLMNVKNLFLGTSVSVFNTFLTVIAVYFLIIGMHDIISFADLSVIYQASNFVAAASLMPGGIGVLEGGLIGMLVLYKIKYEIAVSVAVLVRLLNSGLLSIVGTVCLKVISKQNAEHS